MNSKVKEMSYMKFVSALEENVKRIASGKLTGYSIALESVNKASRSYLGLRIIKDRIGICFDTQGLYDKYCGLECTVLDAIEDIQNESVLALETAPAVEGISCILDSYESAREMLSVKLGPASQAVKAGEYVSKEIAEGLFATAMVTVETPDGLFGTAVSYEFCSQWQVEGDRVYEEALMASEKNDPMFLSRIEDVIFGDGKEISASDMKEQELYVLSTRSKMNGAKALVYRNVLEKLSANGSYFVIPASTDEVLILLDNGDISAEFLSDILRSGNRCVGSDDFLSDTIYRYDKEKGKLISCRIHDEKSRAKNAHLN